MNNCYGNRKRQNGFTLLESIISLALVAVLTTLAVPSFSTVMDSSSIRTTRESIMQDLRLLRSTAMTQHKAVYLCGLDKDGNCERKSNWSDGWMGYVDKNASRDYDLGDEILIHNKSANQDRISVIIHARWKNIKFDEWGVLRTNGHFRICDPQKSGVKSMRVVSMNAMGKFLVKEQEFSCD